ncbi:MAG TPA: hypothetical protein VK619_06825 [Pyrinomonadaceae bacterium]|nr:hypothetical protein [Pyrinomonadaceae bacterium]
MSTGWVRINIPRSFRDTAVWSVHVGDEQGRPGDAIAALAGTCSVVLQARMNLPDISAAARIEMQVCVEPNRLTDIKLPCLLQK